MRWDETWHTMVAWPFGRAAAERLADQVLLELGYQKNDPAPVSTAWPTWQRHGTPWRRVVYFSPRPEGIGSIETTLCKTLSELPAQASHRVVLFTNQALTPKQRRRLQAACTGLNVVELDIFHLERLTALLDQPSMQAARQQHVFDAGHTDGKYGESQAGGILLDQQWSRIQTGQIVGTHIVVNQQSYPLSLHCPEFETPQPGIGGLLSWRARIPAQLAGREPELANLHAWAWEGAAVQADLGANGSNIRMRVVYGDAGVGKTRLAFELAAQLAAQGWQVGQLNNPQLATAMAFGLAGTLLIIDYPELYYLALENLLKALRQQRLAVRLRVLFLCRNRHIISNLLAANAAELQSPAIGLLPLATAKVAWQVFSQAWHSMRRLLGKPRIKPPLHLAGLKQWLTQDAHHADPLIILAFALNLIHQPEATRLGKVEILTSLVQRERLRLAEEVAALPDLPFPGTELMQAMAAVPGCLGPGDLAYLKQNLASEALPLPHAMALQECSLWRPLDIGSGAPSGPQRAGLIEMQPDLLAAYMLYLTLRDNLSDSAQIAAWVWHALVVGVDVGMVVDGAAGGGTAEKNLLRTRLGRLARLSLDCIELSEGQQTMVSALVEHLNGQQALTILNALQSQATLEWPLQPLAVAAARWQCKVLAHLAQLPGSRFDAVAPDWAHSLNNLAVWLSESGDSGDIQAALAANRQALVLKEQLAEQDFLRFAPDLAISLNNSGDLLARRGDGQASLATIARAVAIQQTLVQHDVTKHSPCLAFILNNWSKQLAAQGEIVRALDACQSAVALLETLTQQDFATYAPDLAMALSNLSACLAENGQSAAGLVASERAVTLWKGLAQNNFAAYASDLAAAMNNLSLRLGENGDPVGRLDYMAQAERIWADLAQNNFTAFGAQWAMGLNNLAVDLAELGERTASLQAISQSVTIFDALAEEDFAAYAPALARVLNNLSIELAEAGDQSGGLAAILRAVAIREELAKQNVAAYGGQLISSLNNLAQDWAACGDMVRSQAAKRRAKAIGKKLALT